MATAIASNDLRERRGDGDRNDSGLIGRPVCGDEQAWRHIVTQHTPYLASIGRAYRLCSDEIDDAMQETWLCALNNMSGLRDTARLRPWLATIMRRRCADAVDRIRAARELSAGDVGEVAAELLRDERVDVEHEVVSAERASTLRRALRLLPVRERELLNELAADDPSYEEITRRLSMPAGSVGPTRMRALRRLRGILEQSQAGELQLAS